MRWTDRVADRPSWAGIALPVRPDEVYLARRADGAEVVVRIHGRPLGTERERLRFEQEVSALRDLSTVEHVVEVHDCGVMEDGRPFVVTEYCGGGSLAGHVAMVGRLTPVEVGRIGAKIAGAVMAAHRRAIVHRDVRPGNVYINAAGEPVLGDFGLLCLAPSDRTPPPGPRPFVAPEAYLPELMSAAADIYALGAMLYAALSGASPHPWPADPHRAGPDLAGRVLPGPDRAGPDRAGPDRAGPDRAGPTEPAPTEPAVIYPDQIEPAVI